ncbi:MAG: metallophosphoesterase [Planctomycetales bacterium]|nr:metallophosphoesterase [Planctomycetales bacterium]
MTGLFLLMLLYVFAGHCALWVTVFNRMNAWSCHWLRYSEQAIFVAVSTPFLWAVWHTVSGSLGGVLQEPPAWSVWYACGCGVALTWKLPGWWRQRQAARTAPDALLSHQQRQIDVAAALGEAPASGTGRLWRLIPGNESWQLWIERETVCLPSLPKSMAGITLTHLSDLHLTGLVGKEYFERVVDETNALESDLILVTGDIIDHHRCVPWLQTLFGKLRARHGVFFILGNHDARLGEERVRNELRQAGLISLGGETRSVAWNSLDEHQQATVLLAGDERPWFGAAPPLEHWDDADLRILVAHTPDRYRWAQQQGFDLVVAGHTHGGQVRLPWIGPVLSPSLHGTRYAAGLFDEPPTLMHVSRGISGLQPLRWRCPPELTQLTLMPAGAGERAASS